MSDASSLHAVLIVEDLPDTQRWLKEVIEGAFPTAEIRCAESVRTAQDALHSQAFDLLLIDLGLGDGSGVEVIEAALQLKPPPLCVVTTIFDDDQNIFTALRAGAQGYLLKDSPREELVRALQGIFSGQPPLSPSIAQRILRFFAPFPEPVARLSKRETEVLSLIARGLTTGQAAELLGLQASTVAGYVKEIYRKLQVNSRAEAVLEAARRGLI